MRPKTVTLPEYLSDFACAVRTESGSLETLSRADLVALWGQQRGSNHEDPAIDERLSAVLNSNLFVGGGQSVQSRALCGISSRVRLPPSLVMTPVS
jgi:hypothetical protein